MQLAMAADLWVPWGAGALALLIAMFVLLTRGRRAAPDHDAQAPDHDAQAPGPVPPRTVADAVTQRAATPAADPDRGGGRGGPVAGSDRVMAEAVAHTLAARAGAARTGPSAAVPGSGSTARAGLSAAVPGSGSTARSGAVAGRGDARDRLLAVLLDDPVRAVGAMVELDACRAQVDRLAAALRHEQGVLADVVGRLSAAGLTAEQLARLAALPVEQVRELLAPGVAAAR